MSPNGLNHNTLKRRESPPSQLNTYSTRSKKWHFIKKKLRSKPPAILLPSHSFPTNSIDHSHSLIWWGAKPCTVAQPKGTALIIGVSEKKRFQIHDSTSEYPNVVLTWSLHPPSTRPLYTGLEFSSHPATRSFDRCHRRRMYCHSQTRRTIRGHFSFDRRIITSIPRYYRLQSSQRCDRRNYRST